LFARNVRGFLGNTEINASIQDTLEDEPDNFWYYNNGVTIVCDEARQVGEHGRDVFRIKHPQVINGQQTTKVLAGHGRAGSSLLVRVIRIPRKPGLDTEKFDAMVNNVVRATNWQNKISRLDLMSNDSKQVYLERELKRLNYQYIRKKQSKSEAWAQAGSRAYFQVKKEELAQAVAACELDPSIVREGKERLFEEENYKKIFASSQTSYYLSRYWMMKHVQSVSWGRPEWAYAKWVVLNLVWGTLPYRHQGMARRLIEESEANSDSVDRLRGAIEVAFRTVMRFYRARRGKGERAKDVSTFFKRRNVHKELARFWSGSKNSQRALFRKKIVRHLKLIRGEN
jgi:hypothetical protein